MGQDLKHNEGQVNSQLTLIELLKKDPTNVQAWAMLAKLVDSPERKKIYINKALELEPDNADLQEQARKLGIDAQQKMVAPIPVPDTIEKAEPVAEDLSSTRITQEPSVEDLTHIETQQTVTSLDTIDNIGEATVVAEPKEASSVGEQTVVSENMADAQQDTLVQVDPTPEETLENVPNVAVDPTIEVETAVIPDQEVSLADDARTRVQEILSALGVQPNDTKVVAPSDANIIDDIDETKIVSAPVIEDTILESPPNIANAQQTIFQEVSPLSQQETIVESQAIIDDPLGTIVQEVPASDMAIDAPEFESNAAQQRIDQIRDSIKPMEEPAIQIARPAPNNVASDSQAVFPQNDEPYLEPTEVIDPPRRIVQGLLAVASVIAFSFFAYEFIEFLNNTTGFTWPDYK